MSTKMKKTIRSIKKQVKKHVRTVRNISLPAIPLEKKQISFLEELWQKYSFNRITRMRHRLKDDLDYARKHIRGIARKNIEEYDAELETIAQKMRKLTIAKIITIICLYASVVYATVGDISLLASAVQIAQFLAGILGSTVLFILLAGLNRLTNVYVSDAHIASSYIVAKVMYYREKNGHVNRIRRIIRK
jgi:hypothetical protein